MTLRGDPFMPPEDLADPWDLRLGRLLNRCHRPWVAVRGEDLNLLLRQLTIWQHQAWSQAAEAERLRAELEAAQAQVQALTPHWEPEAAA